MCQVCCEPEEPKKIAEVLITPRKPGDGAGGVTYHWLRQMGYQRPVVKDEDSR